MEELLNCLRERAGRRGFEDWLKNCLASAPFPEEMGAEVVAADAGVVAEEESTAGEDGVSAVSSFPISREAQESSREQEAVAATSLACAERGRRSGRLASSSMRSQSSRAVRGKQPCKKRRHQQTEGDEEDTLRLPDPRCRRQSLAASAPVLQEDLEQPGPSGGHVNAGAAVGQRPIVVWIVGHSFIFWAHRRAAERCYGDNLGFNPEKIVIYWIGIRGLSIFQLKVNVLGFIHVFPWPDIMIIHCGGNDIGKFKSVQLLLDFKTILVQLRDVFIGTMFIWSEIVPRLIWLQQQGFKALERVRRKLNRSIEKFMILEGGLSFRHVDLEGGCEGLYRNDGIHLSAIGCDIFNADLQSMVDEAVVLLEGATNVF